MPRKSISCNPKVTKFNKSVINDKQAPAVRAMAARKSGTIMGLVSKMRK